MKSNQHGTTWPYLAILACLFTLSVLAPRAWQRVAQQPPLAEKLAKRKLARRAVDNNATVAQAESAQRSGWHAARKPRTELSGEASARAFSTAPAATAQAPTSSPAPVEIVEEVTVTENAPAGDDASGANEPAEITETVVIEETVPDVAATAAVDRPDANDTQAFSATPGKTAQTDATEAEDANVADNQSAADDPAAIDSPSDRPTREAQVWATPASLIKQLDRLAEIHGEAAWANKAKGPVLRLFENDKNPREARRALADLRSLATEAAPSSNSERVRAQYALLRRVEVWERLPGFAGNGDRTLVAQSAAISRLAAALQGVDKLVRGKPEGAGWREYLLLARLEEIAKGGDESGSRHLAREVIARLEHARETRENRRFLNDGPMPELAAALETIAAEPIQARDLLAHLEQFETNESASDGHVLAIECRWLAASENEADRKLAERLEERYRNANARLTVDAVLLNRLIPQPAKVEGDVNDTIVGVPVRGRQTTFTKLNLQLIPDDHCVRMSFEAKGKIDSDTMASSGPATFFSCGRSTYRVRKMLVLDPRGLRIWPAEAEATNELNELVGMRTQYDGVPILSNIVRNIALNQHEQSLDEARMEIEPKIARKARTQFDAEVQPRLNKVADDFEHRLMMPLGRLGMSPSIRGLSTTTDRVTIRTCLANTEQIGSHKPRPRAPEESVLTVQVEQSALNNAAQNLDLDGQTFTLKELFHWLGERLGRPNLAAPEDAPEDLVMTFADKDALQFACADGKIELRISLAELQHGQKKWRNFMVRAFYQPETDGLEARFVRDGMLLEGPSFKGRPEILLRSIFSKVLAKNRPWNLVAEKFTKDPRLQDLKIAQFVVQDGWIGLAYSLPPQGPTARPAAPNATRR